MRNSTLQIPNANDRDMESLIAIGVWDMGIVNWDLGFTRDVDLENWNFDLSRYPSRPLSLSAFDMQRSLSPELLVGLPGTGGILSRNVLDPAS